jgi:hypothetical protein
MQDLQNLGMDITGIWSGTIVYGKMYRGHAGKEMVFEMTIEQKTETINGICQDISGVGLNKDPATIKGSIENGKIEFLKQYPSLHFYQKGETKIDSSQRGREINYTGLYDNESHVFTGTWRYTNSKKLLGFIPLRSPSGKWIMHRKDDISLTVLALALVSKGEPINNSYNLTRIFEWQYRFMFTGELFEYIRDAGFVEYELTNGIHYYQLTSKGSELLKEKHEMACQILTERYPKRTEELKNLFSPFEKKE